MGVPVEMYRLFAGGREVPHHIRWASKACGVLTISEENDRTRHRIVPVARLTGGDKVPPLYDARVVCIEGRIVITGLERVAAGPLQDEHQLGQTWWCEPVQTAELRQAELRINALAREVEELRRRLGETS